VYRENRLVRTAVDRRTGRAVGHELVMHNVCPVLYEPGAGVVVHDERRPIAEGGLPGPVMPAA
jgi:hypothetical protein